MRFSFKPRGAASLQARILYEETRRVNRVQTLRKGPFGWPTFPSSITFEAAPPLRARVGTQHLRRSGQPDFEDELSKRATSNYVLVTQELYSHRNTVNHKGT
jgi:hypothetical protein